MAAWGSLVILTIGIVAALSQPDNGDVHHLLRVQVGQHDYILEEYRGSLFASRAQAGGGFSIANQDGQIPLIGIQRNVTRWQGTTIAIPYLIITVFTSIWGFRSLRKKEAIPNE